MVDRSMHAANKYPEIAEMLHDILLGITSPAAMLNLGVMGKVLFA